MPVYNYACDDGHTVEKLRRMSARHDPLDCPECTKPMTLAVSIPHCIPDGVYSYAPNTGSADKFERKHEAAKARKLIHH